jgi:hypothetical protein|nr:MAG TPA: hypothetical protein [Caudoviricetes sp.]
MENRVLPTAASLKSLRNNTCPKGTEELTEYINRLLLQVYTDPEKCEKGGLYLSLGVFHELNVDYDLYINYLRGLGYDVKLDLEGYYLTMSW